MRKIARRNYLAAQALGIEGIEFAYYRAGSSHWRVYMKGGEVLKVVAPNLATESTVIRLVAAQRTGQPVSYPKGAA